MSRIESIGVPKRCGGVTAVDTAELKIEQGELVTLLGSSGCGNSTIRYLFPHLT
jgi:ABC-type Fe3+/spermidine/putrescine transport system ATPase subunit